MTAPGTSPVVVDRTEIHDTAVSALVVRCAGEIDSSNAHELESAVNDGLARVVASPASRVDARPLLVIDLRDVSFFGASAVTALLVGVDTAPPGAALRLVVGDSRPVLLVVDALDLRATFSVHRGLAEALVPAT